MIQKREFMGKRKSSTGVADYFAVLGIDSFVDSHDDEGDAPSADHVGEGGEAVTPRNGNLSSSPMGGGDESRGSDEDGEETAADADGSDRNEYKMHLERFDREIVQLALLSSSEEVGVEWTACRHFEDAVGSSQRQSGLRTDNSARLDLFGASLNIDSVECNGLQLVYKRRGQLGADPSHNEMQSGEMCVGSPATPSKQWNDEYYAPAVADVVIHYVKLHPFSIPNYSQSPRQQHQQTTTQKSTQQSFNVPSNKSLPNTAVAVAAEAAKTISSLVRTSGLTAKGKEICDLGVNVVKGVARGSGSGGTHNNNGDGSAQTTNEESEANQPLHLYDTGKAESVVTNRSFEDVHGDTPQWRERTDAMPQRSSNGGIRQHFFPDTPVAKHAKLKKNESASSPHESDGIIRRQLTEMLPLPDGFDEWTVPNFCQALHLPTSHQLKKMQQRKMLNSTTHLLSSSGQPILLDRTHALPTSPAGKIGPSSPSSMGVEAMYISPLSNPKLGEGRKELDDASRLPFAGGTKIGSESNNNHVTNNAVPDPSVIPTLVSWKTVPTPLTGTVDHGNYVYVPILAVRRQRAGDEERFHEDPAVTDIRLSCLDANGMPPSLPPHEDDDNDDRSKPMMQHGTHPDILKQSPWAPSHLHPKPHHRISEPFFLLRKNIPNGFSDLPFPTRVLDRFPQSNYRDMPFPEEELPMFCYAKGSKLKRDRLRNLEIPKCFGFVVKNERGDSIYVSCLSFYEPLTKQRQRELDDLSKKRQRTSLPHRFHSQRNRRSTPQTIFDKCHMVGFDDVVTFENKTICIVGRYPYWMAFRHFLAHLHLLSGLSSGTPLERHISHLLLSVPVPKPGGQCVLIPLSTMREPMALITPPLKDLPLLDLSYKMLFSALDVPTVVTIVLGFLCLEKKVILTSTRQSLVLDCCELLKSLLFPFDICAPYVPHLTAPFMSCLEFPGATFCGIHDDGDPDGLANIVRRCIPEDSIIVELDSGEIKCDGDRYETLKAAYQIIPSDSRSVLIKEVESLCQAAGLVPGQEFLDYSVDSTIDSTVPSNLSHTFGENGNHELEPLDDRAIRDCFLRFFCSILGGYERFLVVPDADFLISGNDWFDSTKFLSSAPPNRNPYLGSLVTTQLFQSFIQRRTEASDVHCVLFDECLVEYHSSKTPYGLQGNGDLLVDQCATEPDTLLNEDESSFMAKSEADDKSFLQPGSDTTTHASFDSEVTFALNNSGDIVTVPSVAGLPSNARFTYCIDGQPSFPTRFAREFFFPKEPEHLCTDSDESPAPILTRSEREREEAARLLNTTISRRGPQKQHRCLWQLPKFMGSQFLGTWLLCIPTQLSKLSSTSDKSKVLLRALGALRTLRSHRRIIADEAAYRALIVACGKCGTDRRVELMKLYGLMRTDGIFPNAVTLGQYTRAIAEGFSRRSEDTQSKVGMQISTSGPRLATPFNLDILDNNLQMLEESGQKWRSQGNASQIQVTIEKHSSATDENNSKPPISPAKTFDSATSQKATKHKRSWHPVTCSSSFGICSNDLSNKSKQIHLVALWSRAALCDSCHYIPLDEEIQCGWDAIYSSVEKNPSIACPRCGSMFVPLLGFKYLEMTEALSLTGIEDNSLDCEDLNSSREAIANELPPQLDSSIRDGQTCGVSLDQQANTGFVSYFSPYRLRLMLEQLVEEYGEEVLHRDRLLALDPQIFYNLWWYCARFSLPLPLAISETNESLTHPSENVSGDCCAFASWDKSVAIHGCQSAARAIAAAETLHRSPDRALYEKLYDNPNTNTPILSFFNFQNYAQSDWDDPDLSEVLVTLVKACETRDLLPVVECVFERNSARNQKQNAITSHEASALNSSFESLGYSSFSVGESHEVTPGRSIELDCYRTVLYLARYQCITAFHAFFPTMTKACKGYHFWCCQGTPWSIFDRAFKEAAQEYLERNKVIVPISDVGDVAIGFRCIFGHII